MLETPGGLLIEGEYRGQNSQKVVVFSHGFGVDRHGRGLFDDISKALEEEALVVLFDYSKVSEDRQETRIPSLSNQSRILDKVLRYVQSQFHPEEVDLIAHSQGCVVTGILSPDGISKIVLISSPLEPSYETMKTYFSARPETVINESGESRIKRSDGTVTIVQSDFWRDLNRDPSFLYDHLASKTRMTLVLADNDQVIGEQNPSWLVDNPHIKVVELPGNHDFDTNLEVRKALISKVVEELNS